MRICLYSLGDACNMRCSFCIRGKHENSFPHYAKLIVDAIKFRSYLDTLSPCEERITISGGEPTLVNNLSSIYDVLIGQNTKVIQLNSNATASSDVYNELYEYAKQRNLTFRLVLAFHEEFMTLDRYNNLIDNLDFEPVPQIVETESNSTIVNQFKELFPSATISKVRKVGEPSSAIRNPDGFYVMQCGKEPHQKLT